MKKFALCAALFVAASLVGCGGGEAKKTDSPPATTTAPEASTPEAATPAPADATPPAEAAPKTE